MKLENIMRSLIIALFVTTFYCCVPDEIILHGDISGYVTDADSEESLQDASVKVRRYNEISDTTITGDDGNYLLKNLLPGVYEIGVSKQFYTEVNMFTEVNSAITTEIDFALSKLPYPDISVSYLDFGFDNTAITFTISNRGSGSFNYSLASTQSWIEVDPRSGFVSTETDTIRVTINRSGLLKSKYEEVITVISRADEHVQYDKVNVFTNGIVDQDGKHYYDIVTIGTQTWMAENLNTGIMIGPDNSVLPSDNAIIEKSCYENDESNCDTYGGLYEWYEMLDYPAANVENIDIIQGVCPSGWHVSTRDDWQALVQFLGGQEGAGGKLKSRGNLREKTGLWESPNIGATNETDFSGLPGAGMNIEEWGGYRTFRSIGEGASFWMSGTIEDDNVAALWHSHADVEYYQGYFDLNRCSIRCVKDP